MIAGRRMDPEERDAPAPAAGGASAVAAARQAGTLRYDAARSWWAARRHRFPTAEEAELKRKIERFSAGNRRHMAQSLVGTFATLPMALRLRVFCFVPVVPPAVAEDAELLVDVLAVDDSAMLVAPERFAAVAGWAAAALEEHERCLVDSATAAECMGLRGEAARRAVPHPQRERYGQAVARGRHELACLQDRAARIAEWAEFHQQAADTPCAQLRDSLRRELRRWANAIAAWQRQRRDVCSTLAAGEHAALEKRLRAVEFLGDPALEFQDARNIFWEAGTPLPEGVTDGYLQTVTLSQAETLGLLDVPWVRGYSWECRGEAARDAAIAADDRDNVRDTRSAAERAEAEAEAEAAAAEAEAETSRAAEEAERLTRLEARTVAADAMGRRVWVSTLPPRMTRHAHPLGACDLCAAPRIDHVGLRAGSGTTAHTALCDRCYSEEFAPHPALLRLHTWHQVRDLVDDQKLRFVPLVEDPQVDVAPDAA